MAILNINGNIDQPDKKQNYVKVSFDSSGDYGNELDWTIQLQQYDPDENNYVFSDSTTANGISSGSVTFSVLSNTKYRAYIICSPWITSQSESVKIYTNEITTAIQSSFQIFASIKETKIYGFNFNYSYTSNFTPYHLEWTINDNPFNGSISGLNPSTSYTFTIKANCSDLYGDKFEDSITLNGTTYPELIVTNNSYIDINTKQLYINLLASGGNKEYKWVIDINTENLTTNSIGNSYTYIYDNLSLNTIYTLYYTCYSSDGIIQDRQNYSITYPDVSIILTQEAQTESYVKVKFFASGGDGNNYNWTINDSPYFGNNFSLTFYGDPNSQINVIVTCRSGGKTTTTSESFWTSSVSQPNSAKITSINYTVTTNSIIINKISGNYIGNYTIIGPNENDEVIITAQSSDGGSSDTVNFIVYFYPGDFVWGDGKLAKGKKIKDYLNPTNIDKWINHLKKLLQANKQSNLITEPTINSYKTGEIITANFVNSMYSAVGSNTTVNKGDKILASIFIDLGNKISKSEGSHIYEFN